MNQSESVICCEGFHDRAFWGGLLQYAGCKGLKGNLKHQLLDRTGAGLNRGEYAFLGPGGHLVRLQPTQQVGGPLTAARIRLGQLATRSLTRIIICRDSDSEAFSTASDRARESAASLNGWLPDASHRVEGADVHIE
ncbi:MAG: hypothetical protein ACOYN0_11765 [Phycisphaerales bacterium]